MNKFLQDRISSLENQLSMQMELLNSYENKKMLSDDPKEIFRCEHEIEILKKNIEKIEKELHELKQKHEVSKTNDIVKPSPELKQNINNNKIIEYLKGLIITNPKRTLEELKRILNRPEVDQSTKNAIIQLTAQLNNLERDTSMGTISRSEANIERARIIAAILNIIDGIGELGELG